MQDTNGAINKNFINEMHKKSFKEFSNIIDEFSKIEGVEVKNITEITNKKQEKDEYGNLIKEVNTPISFQPGVNELAYEIYNNKSVLKNGRNDYLVRLSINNKNLITALFESSKSGPTYFMNTKRILKTDDENEKDKEKGTIVQDPTRKYKKNFIHYNPYEYKGKTVPNIVEEEYTENDEVVKLGSDDVKIINYVDKDNNPIPIKEGLLLYCNECKQYELAESIEVLITIKSNNPLYNYEDDMLITYNLGSYVHLLNITCKCNNIIDSNNIRIIEEGFKIIRWAEMFEEGDRLVFTIIEEDISCFYDNYIFKHYSNRLTINLKTGRAYLLPKMDLTTKKKIGGIRCVSGVHCINFASKFNAGLENVVYCNLSDEEKNKITMRYFREKVNIHINNLNNNIMNYIYKFKTKHNPIKQPILTPNEFDDTKPHYRHSLDKSHTDFILYNSYNQNPYVSYNKKRDLNQCLLPNQITRIKKIGNANFVDDVINILGYKNKYSKKIILRYIEKIEKQEQMRLGERIRIHDCNDLYKALKDINNFNKAVTNLYESNLQPWYTYGNLKLKDEYYKRLHEQYGETQVINAIFKNKNNFMAYLDTIRNYEIIINSIPKYRLPVKRLRLIDLHDKIASDATRISKAPRTYEYSEKILEVFDDKIINDITFKVAKSNIELTNIGSIMHICVGGYDRHVESKNCFIVYGVKDNKIMTCIEINNEFKVRQVKAYRNNHLSEEDQKTVVEYFNLVGANATDCYDLNSNVIDNNKDRNKQKLKGIDLKIIMQDATYDEATGEIVCSEKQDSLEAII